MRKFVLAGLVLVSSAAWAAPPDVNLSYMDRSVAPGNDFFLYGNGGNNVLVANSGTGGLFGAACRH